MKEGLARLGGPAGPTAVSGIFRPEGLVPVVPAWGDAAGGRLAGSAGARASASAVCGKTGIVILLSLNRQEQRERLFERAFERLAIAFVARVAGGDAAELDRVHGAHWDERDRCRDRRKLRATAGQQRGEDAVHPSGSGRGRAGEDDQAVLAVRIDEQIDVARLVGHRDIAVMRELGVEPLRLTEDQA